MHSFAKQSLSQKRAVHKIGLYIRVSTQEQASNPEGSIRNQEQRLRAPIDLKNFEQPFGEVARVFIDRARSGKDTNRPELQRLLKAVASRDVTMVIVSECAKASSTWETKQRQTSFRSSLPRWRSTPRPSASTTAPQSTTLRSRELRSWENLVPRLWTQKRRFIPK